MVVEVEVVVVEVEVVVVDVEVVVVEVEVEVVVKLPSMAILATGPVPSKTA